MFTLLKTKTSYRVFKFPFMHGDIDDEVLCNKIIPQLKPYSFASQVRSPVIVNFIPLAQPVSRYIVTES